MLLYMALGLSSIGLQLIRSGSLIAGSIRASRTLARRLLAKVVRMPMSFFDSQPTGELARTLQGVCCSCGDMVPCVCIPALYVYQPHLAPAPCTYFMPQTWWP